MKQRGVEHGAHGGVCGIGKQDQRFPLAFADHAERLFADRADANAAVSDGVAFVVQPLKTYENEIFSIGYPSDWEVTYESDDCMNVATEDGEIRFDVTYNERGPMKNQLQEAADNWEYMKKSNGHVVDQKLVKDDYALVRSIETDEDDGTQTVVVWFLMMTQEPQCFSGSIQSPMSRANEAIDILIEMLSTLTQK